MQIEQVIGGVCGDTSAQAIQLRMRAGLQNLVSGARLVAYDAQGFNPVVVIDFMNDVANDGVGVRILITTSNFPFESPPKGFTDFTMTNPIPPSYLAAGRLTFEDDPPIGTINWSLAWGGAAYTGPNNGSLANDDDGNFGPPFVGPLPSSTGQALLFQGAAGDQSSSNDVDYALTPGDATFTNNAGASAPIVFGCIFGDGLESGDVSLWSLVVP